MSNTVEKYVNKANMQSLMSGIKTAIDNGGGGGGGSTEPDGRYAITTDNTTGDISSIVFTYSGGVRTTTFATTSSSKIIVEYDLKTGASTATVRTTTITGNTITRATTYEPVAS